MSKKAAKDNSRKITEGLPNGSSKNGSTSSPSKKKAASIADLTLASKMSSLLGRDIAEYFVLLLGFSAVFLAVILVFLFLRFESEQEKSLASRDSYSYWKEVAEIQKNSPDAYYQAGLHAAEIGKRQEAGELLNKAILLDPGFVEAKELIKNLK